MNLLDTATLRELRSLLTEEDEEAPAVVLSGRDDALSAGLDMKILAAGGGAGEDLFLAMGELLADVYASPTRLVVACRGHAVAAGAMLLLVADVRVGATGRYKIGFSEIAQGMRLPELPVLLARDRLDRRHFLEATLLGRLVDPEAAVEYGFLDEVVPEAELDATAEARAGELAQLSNEAYAGTLGPVRGATLHRMQELLELQRSRS